MFVFRIHIKPGGKGKEFSFDYCLKNGLLGVGWAISVGPGESIDWKTYEERAEKEYGNISKVKYINKWVAKDPLSKDLIWTRTNDGHYYLGMILSPWEYFDNPEAREADIVNVFRVELKKVNIEDVPGKVIACFRSPSTIQEIVDQTAICYTKILWNELSGKDDYQIDSKIDSI